MLGAKFKFNLQRTIDKQVNFELRNLDVEFLFGKWNLPAIKALSKIYLDHEDQLCLNVIGIEAAKVDLENTELNTLIDSVYDSQVEDEFEGESFPKGDPRNIFSDFSNIFLSLYHKKEVPSRLIVREAAKNQDWDKIKKIEN